MPVTGDDKQAFIFKDCKIIKLKQKIYRLYSFTFIIFLLILIKSALHILLRKQRKSFHIYQTGAAFFAKSFYIAQIGVSFFAAQKINPDALFEQYGRF